MPGTDPFVAQFGAAALFGAMLSMALGGFAKGVVGFALPLIGLSALGSFLPYPVAVALLIVPTLVSNLFQALRGGIGLAWAALIRHRWMNISLMAMIFVSAQLVLALPQAWLFAILGVSITGFGLSQLLGWQPRMPSGNRHLVETGVGLVSGFFGGISGIWGPPLIMYMLAIRMPKAEMVRTQCLSFLLGSLVLLVAHVRSGVLNAVTLPVSAWMVVPTMAAMFLGYLVHDRLDQARFRQVTLVVLVLSGLNLLRRAF